jgi:hypothetical protein
MWPFATDWHHMLGMAFGGWQPGGIGSPVAYPTGYLIVIPITALVALLGHHGALIVFLAAIGLIAAFGARAWALDAGCDEIAVSAAAIFAVLNPWTYTKLVAGHEYMLLAYAGAIWFFRELTQRSPRAAVLAGAALLTAQQLQFLFISTIGLGVYAAVRREWRPFALLAVVWLPTLAAMVTNKASLAAIPLLVSWERTQSIAFTDALQLNGYFAQYAGAFRGFFACAVLDTCALAFFGAVLPPYPRPRIALAIGTLAALLVATGARGPLGAPFDWLVEHVHAVGLFRELYDVLGYAAIGFVALAAAACARFRPAGWLWLAAALLLPIVWISHPPARFWVWVQQTPRAAIPAATNERYALVPEFQPMSYDGRGSGSDPDAVNRPGNVTPLNDYLPAYPVTAALGAYALRGDVRPLEALSVGVVVSRPWLQTDVTALAQQWALPFSGFPDRAEPALQRLHPLAELSLLPMPSVGTLDARMGAGEVFFGDAALVRGRLVPAAWNGLHPIVSVRAPSAHTHAAMGWVQAALAFAQRPDLAQGLGGALTTSSTAALALRGGTDALVYVQGTLRGDDGSVVARSTHGYRWVPVSWNVRAVTCDGLCVVAAQGDPPRAPLDPPVHAARPVAFHAIAPWLVTAILPAGPAGTIRYNVAYDGGWAARLAGNALTHVRLDATVNGWLVGRRSHPESLTLVEFPAAIEFALEILATLVVAVVGALVLADRLRRRRRESASSCPAASSSS